MHLLVACDVKLLRMAKFPTVFLQRSYGCIRGAFTNEALFETGFLKCVFHH